jgi:hypothetical protein
MSGPLALLLIAVAVHVLTGVFWTGAAFVLARFGPSTGGLRLRRVQLLAATVSVVVGAWLWIGRRGEWGEAQAQAMQLGAVAAVLAAAVQSALGLGASRRLDGPDDAAARRRLVAVDRFAALLLAVALTAMVLARYI